MFCRDQKQLNGKPSIHMTHKKRRFVMKKITMVFVLAFALSLSFGPLAIQAGAKDMNFKLVSMVEKREAVKVTETEGVMIGVLDRKGLSLFDNGEIAITNCRGIFDTKKGFQGYSSLIFEDGSTIVLSWKGPTSNSADNKYWEYGVAVEYVEGTGRFKGVKGSGSYKAKAPIWDDDYKAKGFTLYEFSGTYTLPSQ
jgi:hypothetical protein